VCHRLVKQLRRITDNEAAIVEGCKIDIGKPVYETYMAEIDWCKNDIIFVCKNLAKWAKDEAAPDIPLHMKLMGPKIRKDPLGAVLVIGFVSYSRVAGRSADRFPHRAYNFPVQLALGPLIGAIAAGNTAILKPSQQAPNVAMVLERIFSSLDQSCYRCIQGGVPETTALLEQKWDKIFYTGSAGVGKIIAKKAAETLTPVVLELGGRNPAVITKNADVKLAARRLLWGKVHNAGQVCISQNYILVDREVMHAFLQELKVSLREFFPNGVKESPDFARIATDRQWKRLKSLIDNSKGKILLGGTMDEKERFLEPTVVEVNDVSDSLIAEETFGPLIPVIAIDDLDHAIRIANEVDSTPLGVYPFGSKAETDRFLREVQSGGASVNDAFFHGSLPTFAFGGVGQSGTGSYRGKASFDCFTHRRSITTTPGWVEGLISIRYPPYKGKLAKLQKMSNKKANFDRNGKVTSSLIGYVLSLGAGSTMGGLARYAVILFGRLYIVHISFLRRTSPEYFANQ
jgi:beta-apo-4'-carotenal oxygenase